MVDEFVRKNVVKHFSFWLVLGVEPIQMQMSGGHLLQSVQKLIAPYIFLPR